MRNREVADVSLRLWTEGRKGRRGRVRTNKRREKCGGTYIDEECRRPSVFEVSLTWLCCVAGPVLLFTKSQTKTMAWQRNDSKSGEPRIPPFSPNRKQQVLAPALQSQTTYLGAETVCLRRTYVNINDHFPRTHACTHARKHTNSTTKCVENIGLKTPALK